MSFKGNLEFSEFFFLFTRLKKKNRVENEINDHVLHGDFYNDSLILSQQNTLTVTRKFTVDRSRVST